MALTRVPWQQPIQALIDRLATDDRIAYALVFGSRARGTARDDSDVDLAIGLQPDRRLDAGASGALVTELEEASGLTVDLVFASCRLQDLLTYCDEVVAWNARTHG
ncbi:MAG: nucleotidyltransferase family protein [Gammaproteobacteria bacterium]